MLFKRCKFQGKHLVLSLCLLLGHLATPVNAASTSLADVPMAVTNSVAPNIMFMLDTSGSMSNIVPDTPYDASVTYLANCPSNSLVAGGAASIDLLNNSNTFDIAIKTDGTARLNVSGTGSGSSNRIFGIETGEFCFSPSLRYNARLIADSTSTSTDTGKCGSTGTPCNYPVNYLPAVYTGNYLNWYFCTGTAPNCNADTNFGLNAKRKPGTSTRIEVAKSATKAIVDGLDLPRVGLSRFNSATSGAGGELVVGVAPNTSTQKTTLKTAIDAFTPFGFTPLAETLSGIGAYFAKVPSGTTALDLIRHKGKTGQSPSYLNQSTASASTVFSGDGASLFNSSSAAAPVEFYCQRSFAVLVTDGRPQADQSVSSSLCDYLGIVGSCPASGTNAYGQKGAPNGTGANVGYHVSGLNLQQHLGGTHGYESAGSDYLDDVAAALFDIDLRPDLTKPSGSTTINNVLTYTIGFADEQAISDPLLREAAAAGGGIFLSAGNTSELVTAFQSAANDILSKDGSAAAVAVANAHVTSSDNSSYASSYNSGTWSGDINSYAIDTTTGIPSTTSQWTSGSASTQLDLRTSANRFIVTSVDTAGTIGGIQFQPTTASTTTKLSAAQQALLNTTSTTDGAAVLAYLRGDRSGETAGTYRTRAHLLGDMINSEPVMVREPSASYADTGYSAFKSSNASRTRMLFQGANDGMLHAFVASTGAESWAYIPNLVIANLNNLSRKTGFNHRYYVDGTPVAGDVDFQNVAGATGSGTNWRTILVGGLGKGGRGYYGLDITTTTAANELAAKDKVLWEFPNSISNTAQRNSAKLNMGYSYGKPIIVKTASKGWVVLVTSGYNNGTNSGDSGGDGLGHLYVVNPKTGDLIADITTPACDATPTSNPCGLAQISAYVASDVDNTTDYVYGGDLNGNVWRFDLSGNSTGWSASKFAVLRDASGTAQSVTTAPELSLVTVGGIASRMVFVGTGKYLGTPDVATTQTQTMYGLKDTLVALPTPLRSNLQQQTLTTSGTSRTISNNTVDYSTKKGWYFDLPSSGERVNTDPALALGALIFTSNIPSSAACLPGGSSWLYIVNVKTGGLVEYSSVAWSGKSLGDTLASRPVLIQLPSGKVVSLVRTSDANTLKEDVPVTAPGTSPRRISWRELFN